MATVAELERLTALLEKLIPRSHLRAGELIRAQDWNEIVVVVKDNVAHCTCNGEVLEAALKLPATGPIGFEADHGKMEYRRIRIKEL